MSTVAQSTMEYTEKLRQALQRDTTLRQLAQQATARYAGDQARIDRGLVLALNGNVTLHADGTASVQSGTDAEIVYTVNGHCDCPDAQRAPEGRCKHRWAKTFVKRAQQSDEYYTSITPAQGLVLGGNRAIADGKRAEEDAAGGLVAIVCGYGK